MPSGLNNRSDNSDAILGQILAGVKKLPGNALGAPVDLVNSALNVAKAAYGYAGSKIGILSADQMPKIIDNPVGGSQSINAAFGMDKSTGTADDITQLLGGFISPENGAMAAGKLGLALKSVILPAALIHDSTTITAAQKLIDAGKADKVYDITGIFPGHESPAPFDQRNPQAYNPNPPLKTVLPDNGATLKSVGGVLRNNYSESSLSAQSSKTYLPSDFSGKLSDVLIHPDLFSAMPELADINVRSQSQIGAGFYASDNTIRMGPASSDQDFTSVLLHETQHAIQHTSGFLTGGNPGMFLRDKDAFNTAILAAQSDALSTPSPINQARFGILKDASAKAYEYYMNIGGEQEARIAQQQFTTGNYSVSPEKTLQNLNAGGEKTIVDPSSVPKIDDDPAVRQIIDYYTNPQSGP